MLWDNNRVLHCSVWSCSLDFIVESDLLSQLSQVLSERCRDPFLFFKAVTRLSSRREACYNRHICLQEVQVSTFDEIQRPTVCPAGH